MTKAFNFSTMQALEAASEHASSTGNKALVDALDEPLADLDMLALWRVPESYDEARELLNCASNRATHRTKWRIDHALHLADAGEWGGDMLAALRAVGAACVGDDGDSIYPGRIAANVLTFASLLRLVTAGGPREYTMAPGEVKAYIRRGV